MFLEQGANPQMLGGWIEVICGCMFSGKTEELIRRLRRAEIAGQRVVIYKPKVDTRYAEDEVVSHDKRSIPSVAVNKANEILEQAKDVDVVGIDEAQFFDEDIVEVANNLANAGHRVVIAGLDLDYTGKPFGPMPNLMAIAEYVTKVHAICQRTGNLAHYSHRIDQSQELIALGHQDHYEPVSRSIFSELMNLDE
jgi:thymidine kinase